MSNNKESAILEAMAFENKDLNLDKNDQISCSKSS